MNMSEDPISEDGNVGISMFRQPTHLLLIYCIAYGLVFALGLIGNSFVVASVLMYPGMRNITNFFITSLAVADLLIIIFCLPATLMNNILTEWLLGNFLCKMSVWVNGTTSCTSVYTLVAVTGDRYVAICHTMRYNVMDKRRSMWIILPIWLISGAIFSPWLIYFKQIDYPIPNSSMVARICFPEFPSAETERLLFLVVNFLIAFLIPLVAITVCYTFIFAAIFRHTSIAVDAKAQERETRVKMRVTNMMLTVIVLFAASWLPLYCLFTYIYFGSPPPNSYMSVIVGKVFRPVFQWLSLANSCINPILYAYFSNKFRRAFQEILVLPCRRRYARVRNFARSTMKRYSSRSHSDYTANAVNQGSPDDVENTRLLTASIGGSPSGRVVGSRSFNAKLSPYGRRQLSSDGGGYSAHASLRPVASTSCNGASTKRRALILRERNSGVADVASPVTERRETTLLRASDVSPPSPARSFSLAGSSLLGSPAPPPPPPAPVISMRDLDISSFNSARNTSLESDADASAENCTLRFVQIRDMTTV